MKGSHAEIAASAMDVAERVGFQNGSEEWLDFLGAFVGAVDEALTNVPSSIPAAMGFAAGVEYRLVHS